MSYDDRQTMQRIASAISEAGKAGTKPYDTPAEVVRLEGKTAWVHIPGGVEETPVSKTIDCRVGDTVQVRVSGGRATITGNATTPPTDDATALKAQARADEAFSDAAVARSAAEVAEQSAASAIQSAGAAATAAAQAVEDAATANSNATQAMADAATARESADSAVEDARVAGVAASVAQAAARAARGDDPDYMNHWFYYDENGAHVLGDSNGYRTDVASDAWEIVDTSTMTPVVGIGATGSHFGSESGMHVALDSTSLALKNGDEAVAYIAIDSDRRSKLYVAKAVILDDLQFVDGNWKWYGRSNGNLALRWMGGDM